MENLERCQNAHANNSLILKGDGNSSERFCPAAWDLYLCWPPTGASQNAYLPCPPLNGIDTSKFAVRTCTSEGQWQVSLDPNNKTDLTASPGWTNYTNCFLPELDVILSEISKDGLERESKIYQIAYFTRIMELIGLCLSLFSLIISLCIFGKFRSLQNHRTRIHKNLFAAISVQVVVRLVIYIDQNINQFSGSVFTNSTTTGIQSTAWLCRSFNIILEYVKTTMFLWMFIEGLYLNNLITVMVFQPDTYHKVYLIFGWGFPFLLTIIWASFVATQQTFSACWWGYNLTASYWILEGPRLAMILMNLIYLLNIIRVLVTKMQDSQCSEAEQLRKAVKAAIVLLPLLGITNIIIMIKAPLDGSVFEFAIWSYSSHFLTSFQGFFVAMLYCFLNGEVRTTLGKKIQNYLMDRRLATSLFGSRGVSAYHSTHTETEREDHEKHPRHLLRTLRETHYNNSAATATTQL